MLRACSLLFVLSLAAAAQDPYPACFLKPGDHAAFETRLVDAVLPDALRKYHDLLASRPHPAGSDGDRHVIAALAGHFRKMGLQVEQQELLLYLAHPVSASVEVRTPDRAIPLSLREKGFDKYSGDPKASFGWNAFSGSGDVTAEVVYANYGRKEDYEHLKEFGVDLKGKIVVARYGGNFRGYKCKFAEAAGAAGLIIYTDPKDSGWGRGVPYPEGGYANGSYIQRGSILTLDYRGDPLTPGKPASPQAERLDPKEVAFPKIPVQPMGWDAAKEILTRMRGASAPDDWQGGLPCRYRYTGGKDLTVRLQVKQERKLTRTYNVTARLKGSVFPDQFMVVGAHHDAWGFGAGDPTAGTILVLEAARCFAQMERRPKRSIVFAAWAAEEYGIMGSTEWVEAHRDDLAENCIAYLNLDMAAMGPNIRSSAAPSLKAVISGAVATETGKPLARLGNLGGGSDHIGFYCHLGIPSAALSAGGSPGVSYHSLYDNLAWYRKIVGDDYAHATKLARVVNRVIARIVDADLLPLRPDYGKDVAGHLQNIEGDWPKLTAAANAIGARAAASYQGALTALPGLPAKDLAKLNRTILHMERAWLSTGLPGRPFYRSLYAAPDENSGYAAWMLPGLRYVVSHGKAPDKMIAAYLKVMERLNARLDTVDALTKPQ